MTATRLDIERAYNVRTQVTKDQMLDYTLYHVIHPNEIAVVCDWLDQQYRVGLDTETSGLNPLTEFIATIQIGYPFGDHPCAFVIDYRCFTPEQLKPVFDRLENRKLIKVGANLKFEYKFLKHHTGCTIRTLQDTQLAEQVIRAGLFPERKGGKSDDEESDSMAYRDSSMWACYMRYFGVSINKDKVIRTSFYKTLPTEYTIEQLSYAADDVIFPAYIWREQEKEIEARSLRSIIKLEMRSIPHTGNAELRGMGIDTEQWLALYQEAEQGRRDSQRKLFALLRGVQQQELFDSKPNEPVLYPRTGKPLNLDSHEQVKWAIKAYCESIQWPYKLVTRDKELNLLRRKHAAEWIQYRFENQRGKALPLPQFMGQILPMVPDTLLPDDHCVLVKTDKDTLRLARVRRQLPRELVDVLLEYSKFSQRVDNFGKEFLKKHVGVDGRIHTEFHQGKASTGRYTTTPNLQNIPTDPRYRKCFIPAKGYKFVIADYSQQEPRLTAQDSQDPVYLATYQNDEDIYINIGEVMLGYRLDPVSLDEELAKRSKADRQLMKTVVLAMAYRMGPNKLWRRLCLAFEDEILAGRMELPTYEYVKELHERFLKMFPKLVEYQDYCSKQASPEVQDTSRKIWDRYIGAPVTWATARCGRKRFFAPDALGVFTAAANSPIQGAAASMSKAAAVMIQDYIDDNGIDAYVVDMVHDELVYECREDQAVQFAQVVRHLMEKAGKFYLPDVPIKAEFPKNTDGTVDYWAKEIKLANAA